MAGNGQQKVNKKVDFQVDQYENVKTAVTAIPVQKGNPHSHWGGVAGL